MLNIVSELRLVPSTAYDKKKKERRKGNKKETGGPIQSIAKDLAKSMPPPCWVTETPSYASFLDPHRSQKSKKDRKGRAQTTDSTHGIT